MRRAVDPLIVGSEPIRARLLVAEEGFRDVDRERDLVTELEKTLWDRIASSLVSGGPEDDDDESGECSTAAVARSIESLDDDIASLIARDMLRLYELTASAPEAFSWPQQRWPSDERESHPQT